MNIFIISEQERDDLRLLYYHHKRQGKNLWEYSKQEFMRAREMLAADPQLSREIYRVPYGKYAIYGAEGVADQLKALHSGTNAAGAF